MPKTGSGRNMGFDFGLENPNACFKRKNRWLFKIDGISASDGVYSLPPSKSARPSVSFKEIEAQHITETVYFPGKPEWKPVTLVLYDLKKNVHPIFEWLADLYDPRSTSEYNASCDGFKKSKAILELYDGCGSKIESWIFESIWPQNIEFGDLDMSSSDLITCELTLRYDRAYIESQN